MSRIFTPKSNCSLMGRRKLLGNICLFFILDQVKFVEALLVLSCASFYTLKKFFRQATVSDGLLLSLPNESKLKMKIVLTS